MKNVIPIYQKNFDISAGDTIQHDTICWYQINISIFWISNQPYNAWQTRSEKRYCKRVQTELDAPPTWPLQGDLPTVHHLRIYRGSAPSGAPLGDFHPCLWPLKAPDYKLGEGRPAPRWPTDVSTSVKQKICGGDDRYDIVLSQCDIRLHWRASQAKYLSITKCCQQNTV